MIEQLLPWLVPGGAGLIAGTILLLRNLSRNKLELIKDRAEENVIEHLIRQRDDALKEASALKAELVSIADENETAVEEIRRLTTDNEQMKSQIKMLNILIKRLAAINNLNLAEPISEKAKGS